jgi:hypothetical protein
MKTGENLHYITLQNNTDTVKLKRDKRLIIGDRAYQIVNYDDLTKYGLYMITLEEHQVNEDLDDITNHIPAKTETNEDETTLW